MHADMHHISTAAPTGSRRLGRVSRRWVRGAAALAFVLFGVFVTLSLWAEPGSPVVFHGDTLMASGRLQQVLDDPSQAARGEGPSVGKGYTDKAGRDCRPFAQGAVEGSACQVEGEWRVIELHQR